MNNSSTSLPNLFIVGAAKAGTTSLYNYLNNHSEIFMSPLKEPGYFGSDIQWKNFRDSYKKSTAINTRKYFAKNPLPEKHISFLDNKKEYLQLFRDGSKFKYKGEASTSYLFSTKAASEIYNFNPNAKIIIILRDPVDRAISHYLMDLSSGSQCETNILKALQTDYNLKKKGWGISNLYIELSLYSKQIERYLTIFPKEQVCILDFNDLKSNKENILKEIFKFLEIKNDDLIIKRNNIIHNKTRLPKNRVVNQLLKLKGVIPESFIQPLKKQTDFLFKSKNDIVIPKETYSFISNLVEKDWEVTQKMI